jgi:hypothetical protein
MDKKTPFAKWIIMALAIVIGATGFGVASLISKTNIYVARAALGCAFIYLLSREIDFRFKGQSFEDLYSFPQTVRYLVWAFGLLFFFYLGLHEIIELVKIVIRSFIYK